MSGRIGNIDRNGMGPTSKLDRITPYQYGTLICRFSGLAALRPRILAAAFQISENFPHFSVDTFYIHVICLDRGEICQE